MVQPLITNERGKREWEFAIRVLGAEAAQQALEFEVALGRKPYPYNVLKRFGLHTKFCEENGYPPPKRSYRKPFAV